MKRKNTSQHKQNIMTHDIKRRKERERNEMKMKKDKHKENADIRERINKLMNQIKKTQ